MHYVILRDDDTNALTPVEHLEQLYRPFLDRGLPVNLAVIPDVRTDATLPDGQYEGYLLARKDRLPPTLPIGTNVELVDYLQANPGYQIAQHGCHHSYREFDQDDAQDVARRLQLGANLLVEAGFDQPVTFVPPYEALSCASLKAVVRRYHVLSTGRLALRRMPVSWRPKYFILKLLRWPLWQAGRTTLLTNPGFPITSAQPRHLLLDDLIASIERQELTVVVTRWWEYFSQGYADESLIQVLHRLADYLGRHSGVQVISLNELADLSGTTAARRFTVAPEVTRPPAHAHVLAGSRHGS